MSLQDRIKLIRSNIASSPEALADELEKKGFKISVPTIYSYEIGRRQPSVAFIDALVEHYQINPMWILRGQGEMFLNDEEKAKASIPANVDFDNIVFIPILNMNVSAGHGSLIDIEKESTKDYISFTKEWLSKITNTNPKHLVGFMVKGDSMQGEINDGDIVIVNTQNNEMSNDGTYAVSINNNMFVKRLQQRPGNEIKVISANPKYEPYTVSLENEHFQIIGNVVWAGVRMDVC